jgi:hypothetical protein
MNRSFRLKLQSKLASYAHKDANTTDPRKKVEQDDRMVDWTCDQIRSALTGEDAAKAAAKAVWDSSPGDWTFDRAEADGSGFLAERIKQQTEFSRLAIVSALDAAGIGPYEPSDTGDKA